MELPDFTSRRAVTDTFEAALHLSIASKHCAGRRGRTPDVEAAGLCRSWPPPEVHAASGMTPRAVALATRTTAKRQTAVP
jgi:hypothetical protein